jgi:hypothetical protein
VTSELIPVDKQQCQAEKPNGNTFMTLGGVPGLVRCTEKPDYIAVENEPDENGVIGSMSLCAKCAVVMQQQLGTDYATLTPIGKTGE